MEITNKSQVLLCNGEFCNKMESHKKGMTHFAFSVFVFNDKKELLIQKRAMGKYHSGGLWSNTCCGHPLTLDTKRIKGSAEKRLMEEMGIICPLSFVDKISYNIRCGSLIENEIDYLYVGSSNETPKINKDEVDDYRWISYESLLLEVYESNNDYTEWFKIIINSNYLKKYFI